MSPLRSSYLNGRTLHFQLRQDKTKSILRRPLALGLSLRTVEQRLQNAALFPIFLVAYVRCAPFVLAFKISKAHYPALAACVLLVGWAPMAVWAFWRCEYTEVRWWPLLSFFPFVRLLSKPLATLRRFWSHLRRFGVAYAIVAAIIAAIEFIFLGALERRPYVAALLIFGALAVGLLILFSQWTADCWQFRRWLSITGTLAPADFLEALRSYRLNSFRIRFIRLVGGNSALPATAATVTSLGHLNLALERALRAQDSTQPADSGDAIIDDWKRRYYTGRRRRTLRAWGMPVLDELTRLEQSLSERLPNTCS